MAGARACSGRRRDSCASPSCQDSDRTRAKTDTGEFNPELGFSYNEIAGQSRSNHRSQGFGACRTHERLPDGALIVPVDGDPHEAGISWKGSTPHGTGCRAARRCRNCWTKRGPRLLRSRRSGSFRNCLQRGLSSHAMPGPARSANSRELDETVALAAGLWMEVAADRHRVVPGDDLS